MAWNTLHAGLRTNMIFSVQMSKLCQPHTKNIKHDVRIYGVQV